MTQDEKNILIKDLCVRLPYETKISVDNKIETLQGISISDNVAEYDSFLSSDIEEVKPYLFPMSSMTSEHIFEINNMFGGDFDIDGRISLTYLEIDALFEYFYKNHFDCNGLIPLGLAIDATGLDIY